MVTMTMTTDAVRRPTLDRPIAMRLARDEYTRFADLLATLEPQDWARQTDCPEWTVRDMAGHVLGMAKFAASIREGGRQRKLAAAAGGVFIDALTDLQVRDHAHLSNADVAAECRAVGPKAARGRRWTPGFVRSRPLPVPQLVNGAMESWAIGYLTDVILTRDTWMHRIDITRATGRPMVLTADHDGAIVADVVAEWAERHGASYRLDLTGPAGGTFGRSDGEGAGESITMDAVEFCRAVADRAPKPGLLATSVPF